MAYMISPRSRAEYNTVNFTYATILIESGKEQEALDKLTAAKAEWESGDRTSESFSKLADSFYDSESDKEDGGSYVRISMGDMIDEIDSWIFNDSRKEGDCEIIKTESAYHLIYFASKDIAKWKLDVKSQMSYDNVVTTYEDVSRSEGVDILGINIVMYC